MATDVLACSTGWATQHAWQSGIQRWPGLGHPGGGRAQKLASVADKRLFFRLIGPIVLRVNELIVADRAREGDYGQFQIGEGVSPEDCGG